MEGTGGFIIDAFRSVAEVEVNIILEHQVL